MSDLCYVTEELWLLCSESPQSPAKLKSTHPRNVKITGLLPATEDDKVFFIHIGPFGKCNKIERECGYFHKRNLSDWYNLPATNVFISGSRPLGKESKCNCEYGGIIRIYLSKEEALNSGIKSSFKIPSVLESFITTGILVLGAGQAIPALFGAAQSAGQVIAGGTEIVTSFVGGLGSVIWKSDKLADKIGGALLYLGADPSLTGDVMDFFDNLAGVFQNYTDGQAYLSLALSAADLAVHGDVKPNGRLYKSDNDKKASTCFVAGTLIQGKKIRGIEDIKEGDYVYSYNELTKKKEEKEVLQTFIHEVREILVIYLENGELIRTTKEHPFYIGDKYLEAFELRDGMFLSSDIYSKIKIEKIEEENLEEEIKVYNIEVRENQNYFIGNSFVLVHNKKVTGIRNIKEDSNIEIKNISEANDYYNKVRNNPVDYEDVAEISKNTGYREKDIKAIKDHIFYEKHDLGNGRIDYFDSDIEIVDAWENLKSNKYKNEDILLLDHEFWELNYMKQNKVNYIEGHRNANDFYNWEKEIDRLKETERNK